MHYNSIELILYAVFKNNAELKTTMHLGIFLKLLDNGPPYGRRSFVIDIVALMPWVDGEA
jgi:hypothetical protein